MYYACLIFDTIDSNVIKHYLSIIGSSHPPIAWCELVLLENEFGEGSGLIREVIKADSSKSETFDGLYGAVALTEELSRRDSLCQYLGRIAKDSYITDHRIDVIMTRNLIDKFAAIWNQLSVAMIESNINEAILLTKMIRIQIIPILILFAYDDASFRLAIFKNIEQRKALHDAATSWGADVFDFEISE